MNIKNEITGLSYNYYSSYIVGFEDVVERVFKETCTSVKIKQILNGGILIEAPNSSSIPCGFINNHFIVFKYAKENNIINFINSLDKVKIHRNCSKRSFRVIISDQNNLVSIDNKVLTKLEKIIERETGHRVNRAKPDIEYWVLKRSEGIILFMERIWKHWSFDKMLNQGELREDLCYFLHYLSKPNKDDIFLDPFCGSGAIIKNRLKYNFPFGKPQLVFGIDTEEHHIKELKSQFKKKNTIIFKNIDFFDNTFEANFIDRIVTDPPWGLFEKIDNIQLFYQNFFDEAYRILKPNGIITILTACKDEIEKLETELVLLEKYNILVNGKKAGVYVYQKME